MSPSTPSALASVFIKPGRGWMRFAYERPDMDFLGVIQLGMQIGALARLPSGELAQVNGDFIELLDAGDLMNALRGSGQSTMCALIQPVVMPAAPATVVIKKRRRVELSNVG